MSRHVVIVGGGLAGIAASAALNGHGYRTTLIERRRFLGGRATSFPDPQSGEMLDNCQHVLLGCCTNLLHLYKTLGIGDRIEFFDTIHFMDERGRRGDLYATALPSPVHLSASMLRLPLFSFAQKVEIARAMLALKLLGRDGRAPYQDVTFADWLREHRQSPETIRRFWNVILTSALNEDVERISAEPSMQVFQESFLGHRGGYRMALPAVPLAALYERAIADRVMTNSRVTDLLFDGRAVRGVRLSDGQTLEADVTILAVAPDSARRLSENIPALDDLRRRLDQFEFSPIIGAHLFYDRPVMPDLPHVALIGTTLQWLFRKDADGRQLHGVVSAARGLVDADQTALAGRFDAEIRQLLPAARHARLLRGVIIKERRATFTPRPGVHALRPTQSTDVPGLFLAGDYTQTAWPATMEGAARSGYLAAEALTRAQGRPETFLQPDLR